MLLEALRSLMFRELDSEFDHSLSELKYDELILLIKSKKDVDIKHFCNGRMCVEVMPIVLFLLNMLIQGQTTKLFRDLRNGDTRRNLPDHIAVFFHAFPWPVKGSFKVPLCMTLRVPLLL